MGEQTPPVPIIDDSARYKSKPKLTRKVRPWYVVWIANFARDWADTLRYYQGS